MLMPRRRLQPQPVGPELRDEAQGAAPALALLAGAHGAGEAEVVRPHLRLSWHKPPRGNGSIPGVD